MNKCALYVYTYISVIELESSVIELEHSLIHLKIN